MQNQEFFSSIPMRTWRWLGVNGAVLPEGLAGVETSDIHVKAGEKKEAVYVCRAGGRAEIKAHIEKGAVLSLVKVQLVPETESHADDIEVHVEEDGSFSCTIIARASSSSMPRLVR